MNEFLAIFFQIALYIGIIIFIAYFIYPLNYNIEHYFKDKVVWITGATSGIAPQLAKELIRLSPSTRLVLSARCENELKTLTNRFHLASDNCLILPLDLELHNYFTSKVNLILDRFDSIDILINNDEVLERNLIAATSDSVDSRLMSINVLGTMSLTKAVLQYFIECQKGHFVLVTSAHGYAATALCSSHAASKHALRAFFECLRLEHVKDNIDVTIACPGFAKENISINHIGEARESSNATSSIRNQEAYPSDFVYDVLCTIAARKHEIHIGYLTALVIYLRCRLRLLYLTLLRIETS